MGLLRGTRRALLGAARELAYYEKVMATGPLVYFPQWEAAGLVSEELVNGWNGAYTGVTLGQPGIGDGNTSPFFDGVNDFNNIMTAGFLAGWSSQEGTMAIWARVFNVGVWTDAAFRVCCRLIVNAPNLIDLVKSNVNNQFTFRYTAGAVASQVNLGGLTTTDWFYAAVTWSVSTPPTGEVRAYYNGAQTGATQVGLGVWAGALANATIGAGSPLPNAVWHGWLAHGAIWDRALAPGEIADLAVV